MTAQLIGPFLEEHRVVVDGYAVPHITATRLSECEYNLILDGRFSIMVHTDDIDQIVWFVANAMAIGAGFTCHGKHSEPYNRYKVQLMEIGSVDSDDN